MTALVMVVVVVVVDDVVATKQVDVWSDSRQCVVVLYAHHYLLLHCQPRRLSHHRAHADADRVR